jgi:hypothetical protein
MARPAARVLSSPVTQDPQLSAFPAESRTDMLRRINRECANPEIAVLRLQHEMLRLQRLGPFMDAHDTLAISGEIELLIRALDAIEAQIKRATVQQAQALGLTA